MKRADAGTGLGKESQARRSLLERFVSIRAASVTVAGLFAPEDRLLQAMPDASPIKWHLAHTTWFFETFLLRALPEYRALDDRYEGLFNSYYNAVGPQAKRAERGLWSRPNSEEVSAYRRHVDESVEKFMDRFDASALERLELGLHHEQQHQELMLTDTLAALAKNPMQPAVVPSGQDGGPASEFEASHRGGPLDFLRFEGGKFRLGYSGQGFHFDNESPQHDVLLPPYLLASRPVTNAEVIEFIDAGGYRRPELWLSDGFDWVRTSGCQLPCYWSRSGRGYEQFTLHGTRAVEPVRTACHLNYFEADALARYFDARLPTEAEWEFAARTYELERPEAPREQWFSPVNLVPGVPARKTLAQLFGTVWEWTSSPYIPYPGFRPAAGAIGEYNGKFMFGQMVLRGGSLATPVGHIRSTYRNFFPASAQWQFSGVRLARDVMV